jgi:hypothetical protein
MYFVCISDWTANVALFIESVAEFESVYCAVRTESFNKQDYVSFSKG